MMAENKTKATAAEPSSFVNGIDDEQKRKDSEELIKLMRKVTGEPPKMWGGSIIGFGKYRYRYESGREGEMCLTGFSPRKPNLVLYLGSVLGDNDLLSGLGKYTVGEGCLYIKKLEDVDREVLKKIITKSVEQARKNHPARD
jgi:hypothetical protein